MHPNDDLIRKIAAAGRTVSNDIDERSANSSSIRTIASVLTGITLDKRSISTAYADLADDPLGIHRLQAMSDELVRSIQNDNQPSELLLSAISTHIDIANVIGQRRKATELTYEDFSNVTTNISEAQSFHDTCRKSADALRTLSNYSAAAIYIPSSEYARMIRVSRDTSLSFLDNDEQDIDGQRSFDTPSSIQIDKGIFADVIAASRPAFITKADPIEDYFSSDVRSLVVVPLRDQLGRLIGLMLAIDPQVIKLELNSVVAIRRLAGITAGELRSATARRRSTAALSALPKLADAAHADTADIVSQLDELAQIVLESTESDSVVIRVRDASGQFLDTRTIVSKIGNSTADAIGSRTSIVDDHAEVKPPSLGARSTPQKQLRADLDPAEIGVKEHEFLVEGEHTQWSTAGQRILRELSARCVASYPIDSRYGRFAVLYVIRNTARSFDEVDRACIRIATAHAQHIIDRHVSQSQTARAIDAARNAVRLLGEALVAGVRTERTLRFIPRLFHEMFSSSGVRAWHLDTHGSILLVAGAGKMEADQNATDALLRAFERPLTVDLDTTKTPNVAAVALNGYAGVRIGVEFELAGLRAFGVEEQRLAVDVASRIEEALISAGQSAAQKKQLDRVRELQDIVAKAHERLREQHVIDTILESLPEYYNAHASAIFIAEDRGTLSCYGTSGIPKNIVNAIEGNRSWNDDTFEDDQTGLVTIARVGFDDRLSKNLRNSINSEGLGDHAAAIIPIVGNKQTLGVILLTFIGGIPLELANQVSNQLDGTLKSFGKHIGSALLNAREFERERRRRRINQRELTTERENLRQIKALHEVSRAFANSLSFDETLRAVVEAMAERLDVDAVWIRQLDDRGELMTLRAFHSARQEISEALERIIAIPESREDPVTVEVLRSRRAVLITDPDDNRWKNSSLLDRLAPFLQHGSTLATLPLLRPGASADDVMGTLTLLSLDAQHALGSDKIDVATSVSDQAALALDNARLYQQQKSFAEIIQESLLPRRLPDTPNIDFGVLYRSAVIGGDAPQIGGDFYDFLELDDGRLAMALGDVTGKGVQAAADTAMTKYVFRSLAREHPQPASFLRYANEVVCDEISAGKFVTLFYALIDPKTSTLTCGLAGHPEPKILYPQGTIHPNTDVEATEPYIESISMEGLALGILGDQDYEQRTYYFPPGSALVVYTDGVVEARRKGKLYGQFRLERRILEESHGGAGQIAYSIYEDCQAYSEHGLNDDVAIVVVRHMP